MKVYLLGLGLALAATQAWADESLLLACTGPFAKNADEAALVKAFGRANVVTTDLDGPEGQTEKGWVVFPKDPKRRLEIFWWGEGRKRRPASVRVPDGSGWALKAHPSAIETLKRGSTLVEVEAANGGPFALSGFGWDYGGLSNDWKGGKLDKIEGGCSLSVRFEPDPKAKDAALKRVSGDGKALRSDGAAVKAVRPTVSAISLGWPE